MKQLILVRHGEPDVVGTEGRRDPPLSAKGHRQAGFVGERLKAEAIDRIVSSPLTRAFQTAEPLAAAKAMQIVEDPGVAEVDQDGADYVSVEALRREGGARWQAFLDDPVAALGGDRAGFVEGVRTALGQLLAGPGQRIAIFTHGLPINVALTVALGHDDLIRFAPRHTSVTRMAGSSLDDLKLLSFNEATHLPAGGG
ncbi:MAG: histidine phosphatase family protein [Pacificimonas sp.]